MYYEFSFKKMCCGIKFLVFNHHNIVNLLAKHECFEDRFMIVFLTDTTLSNMAAQPGCVSQTDVHKSCHGTLDCKYVRLLNITY